MFRRLFGRPKQKKHTTPASVAEDSARRTIAIDETAVLEVLSMFTEAADPKLRVAREWRQVWQAKLGTSFEAVADALLKQGLLREATPLERLTMAHKLSGLKEIARKRNLKISGRKAELAERILASDTAENPVTLPSSCLLNCSQTAREAVEQHRETKKAAEADAMAETERLLKDKKLREACEVVCAFEMKQFFPRGLNVDWANKEANLFADIRPLFSRTPKFHKRRFGEVTDEMRVGAAQSVLWGRSIRTSGEDGTDVSAAEIELFQGMLVFHANYRRDLKQARELASRGMQIECEICAVEDYNTTCVACVQGDGKRYALTDVPELPHEHCECEIGCRCVLLASVALD